MPGAVGSARGRRHRQRDIRNTTAAGDCKLGYSFELILIQLVHWLTLPFPWPFGPDQEPLALLRAANWPVPIAAQENATLACTIEWPATQPDRRR